MSEPLRPLFQPFPKLFLPVLALMLALCAPAARADSYLDTLVAQARAQGLHEHPTWLALLHYQPRLRLLPQRSLADSPDFFNAPEGANDARAELAATLAAFFAPPLAEPNKPATTPATAAKPLLQHPQCRFVARYHWLRAQLHFDPTRLPPQPCPDFAQWRKALDPASVALVFPAAYLNNPASMYGHTFLRIDARAQDDRSRLLAYAINYAADTNETNGLVFAVRGLFGGYDGRFSLMPYYVKVGEYNDLENRDMWEYELNLNAEEIDRLLMHAWELGPTRFDYYFFDENCSYHLLSLLDVARPGLNLVDRFPLWVIPGDTVRVVAEQEGLVRRVGYRPARSTQLRHRMDRLPPPQVAQARALADGSLALNAPELAALPAQQHAEVLELAFEYLEYRRLRGDVSNRDAAPRLRALLAARSRIDAPDTPEVPPPKVRPEHGHSSSRIALAGGGNGTRSWQELRFRPAYHDLLDREAGYIRGAEIQFGDLALRHELDTDRWHVQRFDLVHIVSLAPRDALLSPPSWRLQAGAQRMDLADGSRRLLGRVGGGSGASYTLGDAVLAYTLIESSLLGGHGLQHRYALGLGASTGLLMDPTERWRVHLNARSLRYAAGEMHTRHELTLDQRLALTTNTALRLEARWQQAYDRIERSANLVLDIHL